ncbi:hypothetical protein A4D02_11560 [Niastella koreensis]|uniref:Uncharacterized protein n=2 Tax=Niastella koreensis TaxID=354356 RepID=G8TAL7_NIAKG|nr:hypothetical protein Niako_2863 [Niastella koreensis GR20-10]OQP44098.1 hypothetical protein A4D02_11560 [Niastella koreensis]
MSNHVKRYLLLSTIFFGAIYCNAQKLIIQDYDTSLTKNILKKKWLESYRQKNDSSDITILFYQLVNQPKIKSFAFKVRDGRCKINILTKDSIFPKDGYRIVDFNKVKNTLLRFNNNLDISEENFTTSTYFIIIVIKIGTDVYQIKTTNLAFYSDSNDYIDSIKNLLFIFNLNYKDIVMEHVDG